MISGIQFGANLTSLVDFHKDEIEKIEDKIATAIKHSANADSFQVILIRTPALSDSLNKTPLAGLDFILAGIKGLLTKKVKAPEATFTAVVQKPLSKETKQYKDRYNPNVELGDNVRERGASDIYYTVVGKDIEIPFDESASSRIQTIVAEAVSYSKTSY